MQSAPSASRALTQSVGGRGRDLPAVRAHTVRMLVAVAVTGAVVCVIALLAGGGQPATVPPGLPDPGATTGWSLRLVRLLGDLTAVLTVGSLMVGAVLLPPDRGRGGALASTAARAMRAGGLWAAAWAALATWTVLLTAADTAGAPVEDLGLSLLGQAFSTTPVRAPALMAAGALAVAVTATRVGTVRGGRRLLLIALASLLPVALSGHASTTAGADVAATGLVVHVVAAAVWTGGLGGLLLHVRGSPADLCVALGRFSVLALAAYVALALSGLLTATTLLPSVSAWSSGYGAVVAAKMAVLVILGVLGHLHRRRTLPALLTGRARPLLRLAGVELVVMGAAMGLAAALARTPVPAAAPSTIVPSHGSGHSSLPAAVDPVSLVELATAWRPNAIVLVGLGLAMALYAAGVRIVVRRGGSWPAQRSAAFMAGLLLALVDLCSGVATYAPAMVSVQMAQLLVMLLPVPALLLLGAPFTLWLRATGPDATADPTAVPWSPTARAVLDPVVGGALACALLIGVYRTPLVELSVRSFWVHLLVLTLGLAAGLLLLWPVLGVDPVPEPRGLLVRGSCVCAVAGSLMLLAVQLRYGNRLLAGDWFLELRWDWVDPVVDQRLAGAIVGAVAAAIVLFLVVAALTGRRARL